MTDEDYDIDGLGHLVTEPTMFGGVKMNPWTYRDMVDDFVQEAAVREFHAKAAIVALQQDVGLLEIELRSLKNVFGGDKRDDD